MPGIPMFRTGTRGNESGNANPEVLGRNPGTADVAPDRYGRTAYVEDRIQFGAS